MTTVKEFYQRFRDNQIVHSQADFSKACGRKKTWTSSSMSRDRHMPLDTMVTSYCYLLKRRTEALAEDDLCKVARTEKVARELWGRICMTAEHHHGHP